jgi:hypothetical protein
MTSGLPAALEERLGAWSWAKRVKCIQVKVLPPEGGYLAVFGKRRAAQRSLPPLALGCMYELLASDSRWSSIVAVDSNSDPAVAICGSSPAGPLQRPPVVIS